MGTFSQPGGRAGLGRRVFCVMRPLGIAGSAGWLTDKEAVQAGPGEHKGQRQARLVPPGHSVWVGGTCPGLPKPSHFPGGGLTRPDHAGNKV